MEETILRNLIFSFLPEKLFILLFFKYLSISSYCQSQVFSLENTPASSILENQNKIKQNKSKQHSIPRLPCQKLHQTQT